MTACPTQDSAVVGSISPNDYQGMSVPDLRRLVLERGLAKGAAVASARKSDLIDLLEGRREALATPALASPVNQTMADMFATLARTAIDDELGQRGDIRPVINITLPDGSVNAMAENERLHKIFPQALKLLAVLKKILIVGPSGSGKSHIAPQLAKGLGAKNYGGLSFSAGVTESGLYGRVLPQSDGSWQYTRSEFVRIWAEGGLFLLDEIDAADPNLLVSLNSALSNGKLYIPNAPGLEPIEKHVETYIVVTANTWGNGADRQYVGRNQLDAATVNRFALGKLYMDYDAELERELTVSIAGTEQAEIILNWFTALRERVNSNRYRRIVSTRNVIDAATLIAAGVSMSEIKETYLSDWSADEKRTVTE